MIVSHSAFELDDIATSTLSKFTSTFEKSAAGASVKDNFIDATSLEGAVVVVVAGGVGHPLRIRSKDARDKTMREIIFLDI